MSEQENPIERDGVIVMPRFQSAMADLGAKLRGIQEEAEAKRLAELRSVIREEVERALHPAGLADVREHRRVEMIEESGKHWRGILYAVEEEKEL